jgi:hypothetical protein
VRALPAVALAPAVLAGLVAPMNLAAAALLPVAVSALRQTLVAARVLEPAFLLLLALAAAIPLLLHAILLRDWTSERSGR